ncbi:MAG: SDR family oxidoreductase [Chitinivibrionales bacterium]|nr:SDR family oxidoreductase [Chitinivibrionales bacterium]
MKTLSFDDLKGKTCAITGGGGVIGTALVRGLASAGVKCAILDIALEPAQKLAAAVTEEFGVDALGVEANVLDRDSLTAARKTINDTLGPIELLINGAGGNSPKATTKAEFMSRDNIDKPEETFFGLDIEGFRRVFDLNFLGTLLPSMILTADMLENGAGVVLNISSMNSFRPLTKIPAYSAAKASINNFTQWLAVHLAKVGIRVNAIAPGFFLTQQNKFLLTDEKTGELTPRGQKIIGGTPMGRFGEPEELQGTALYLLSDVSGFVTGVVVPVDGGFSAYSGV